MKVKTFSDIEEMLSGETVASEDIKRLNALLRRFGYMKMRKPHTGEQLVADDNFGPRTLAAVKQYQRYHGLKVDGIAGPKTKANIMSPRCGLPDNTTMAHFSMVGCKWNMSHLTYAYTNDPQDIQTNDAQVTIHEAFEEWAAVTNLRFSQVSQFDNPNIHIGWHSGAHGDTDSFDGVGNVIAHAYFPPPCGGVWAGHMHFDESETFTVLPNEPGLNLKSVAVHEIGHLLGLSHSDVNGAIMYPLYRDDVVTLADDDIEGIQSLYGTPRMNMTAQVSGVVEDGGKTLYAIDLKQDARITLDGPEEADLDLYVKLGKAPQKHDFDFRSWSFSSHEELLIPVKKSGRYYILVCSYEGGGPFNLTIELQ